MGKVDELENTSNADDGALMQDALDDVTGAHTEKNPGEAGAPDPLPPDAPGAADAAVSPAVTPGASPDADAGSGRAKAHNP